MKKLLLPVVLLLGLALPSRADTVLVANQGDNSISQYDARGNASPFNNAFVNGPIGLAFDRAGNLFVSTNSNTIQKLSPTGADLGIFASNQINFPMALAFDRAGNLYVANFGSSTVRKYTPSGVGSLFTSVVRPTGLAFDGNGVLYVSTAGNTIERFSASGSNLGPLTNGLSNPEGLAFDAAGDLYVANAGAGTIEKFSTAGADLGLVASGLDGPVGLAFDGAGNLYVSNLFSATIVKITSAGTATTFATTGSNPGFLAVQLSPVLVNISTRSRVLTGENVLDAGFIARGPGTKQILIRGLGPSLAGVPAPLDDPVLELHSGTGALLQTNDDWKSTQQSAIIATGIPPQNALESAILATVTAGSYTVIERGKNGQTGVGLVEIYDLSPDFGPSLVNISTRGFVGTQNDVMIAGVIVGGRTSGSSTLLFRGLGPSLGRAGVTQPLADPVLELFDRDGNRLLRNDNWATTQGSAIRATGLQPNDGAEAALLVVLAAGQYTAIESGKDGATGVGLVEVYDLD